MSSETPPIARLTIKKYTNRRFYDTTRSCHVTLSDLHDLVAAGNELTIIDSKTGEDITNLVLTQIILERDASKLDMFPANILHQMIRTQQQFLGTVIDQFFAQALATHRASQERWTQFLRNTVGLTPGFPASPLDWTRTLMDAFTPRPNATNEGAARGPAADATRSPREAQTGAGADNPTAAEQELAALREQLAELTRKVEQMK
jgi:polyhydroxyalkanoate synthesis repressor PhaR